MYNANSEQRTANSEQPELCSLITIIIPVYKVEKYLDKCVESVINQTYRNLEIILVDDGSPDNCPAMCDEWGRKDDRIRVIHKPNGGYASARNSGLEASTGTLIGIIDSDDYIAHDMYEKLYALMASNNADVSVCEFQRIDEDNNFISDKQGLRDEVLTGMQALEGFVRGSISWRMVVVWNKLYRREIFTGISFLDGSLHEDEAIIHHVLGACNRVAITGEALHFYLQRSTSTMGEIKSKIFHAKHFHDAMYAFRDRYEYLQSIERQDLAKHYARQIYGHILGYLHRVNYLQYRKYMHSEILYTFKILLTSKNVGNVLRAVKLFLALVRSSFRPYIKD